MRCTDLHPGPMIIVMEEQKMTFYGYMKRHYYGREGRKADLANDMAGDGTTTSVVLAQGLIAEGVKVRQNDT